MRINDLAPVHAVEHCGNEHDAKVSFLLLSHSFFHPELRLGVRWIDKREATPIGLQAIKFCFCCLCARFEVTRKFRSNKLFEPYWCHISLYIVLPGSFPATLHLSKILGCTLSFQLIIQDGKNAHLPSHKKR